MKQAMDSLRIFRKYQPLLGQLVMKDIKLKYRRSFLGYLWSILNPLMIMLIMLIVFSSMFKAEIKNFAAYLIIGQMIFGFVSDATNLAMSSINGNAALIKKVYVPKYIFTMSKITSSFVNMMFSLAAMIIVFIITHVSPNVYMFFIPAILVEEYIFCLGLGLFLAQAAVFFKDIQYIYSAFLTAWMYFTPIFYPIEQLPSVLQNTIRYCNPVYSYILQFRTIVLTGSFPDLSVIAYGFITAFIMLLAGAWFFAKNQDRFILYI